MSEIEGIIATLRRLGAKNIEEKIAARAAPKVQAALEQTLAAGETSEGKAWAPGKRTARPYAHAASRISTKYAGNLVRVMLSGPEVYGHFGSNRMVNRPMIPDAGAAVPKSVTDAITTAAREVFEEEVSR